MKMRLIISLGILVFLFGIIVSAVGSSEVENAKYQTSQSANGVVLIDDIHSNDYASAGNMDSLYADLESLGFLPYFVSDFASWNEAFVYGNYFVMTAPLSDLTSGEITAVVNWAESGTRGILISSRGDFSSVSFSSVNSLLTELGADVRVQDDNIESTSPLGSAWSISSSNIQNTVPALSANINELAMFSPSSLRFIASSADVVVYGDHDEYQLSNNPPAPNTIYDDTADGTGGTSIPLVSHEELSLGTTVDKLIVTGTTMWSDFDYPVKLNNIDFVHNVMNYFKDHIISIEGSISIITPDSAPEIKISFPRADSVVKGTVTISVEITDRVAIDNAGIYIDDVLKSSSNVYNWDTTQETKGEHVIKVVATNVNAITSTFTQTVIVDQDYVPVVNPKGKIMEYNIRLGGEYPEWLDVMKEENADIAILVETGGWDANNNEKLTTNMNILNTYFQDQVNYEGVVDIKESSTSGVAILSRYPINSANELTTLTLDDGTIFAPSHDFVHVNLQVGDVEVAVIGGHLKCCSGEDNEVKRENAQEGIINYMDSLGDIPIIYAMDMNSAYPGEGTDLGSEPISMLIDTTEPRSSTIHTFTDVHKVLNPGVDGDTYITGSRIDFIFVNQHLVDLLIISTTADTESSNLGSDHFTVDVTIDFRTFLGIPTTSDSTMTSSSDETSSITPSDVISSSKESDSSLRLDFFVLPVIFLVVIRYKKQFKK